jgi:hypothetical protein
MQVFWKNACIAENYLQLLQLKGESSSSLCYRRWAKGPLIGTGSKVDRTQDLTPYKKRSIERAVRWSGKALAVAFALEFSPLKIVQQNSNATAIVAHLSALPRHN